MTNETSILNCSPQICTFIATFYQMSLRDRYMSEDFYKKILSIQTLSIMSHMKPAISQFDEVAVAMVEGDFSTMGQIRYGNRILCLVTGYNEEELKGCTVHAIMPSLVALYHNSFWNSFASSGIPKVLNNVRYLFVKHKNGHVFPARIYVQFQYHLEYGYIFCGIIKKLEKVIFAEIERPIKIAGVCVMIANRDGKIMEVTKNC